LLSSLSTSDDADDATELQIQPIRSAPRPDNQSFFGPDNDDEPHESRVETPPRPQAGGFWWRITNFWGNHITVVVPGSSARDHLALERTYLSYHRTSLTLTMMSVVISQLQVLQHAPNPDPRFGFYVLGRPLAAALVCCAIITSIVGFVRWHHWQRTLLRGNAISGGWEFSTIGVMGFCLLVALLGLMLAVEVRKTYF
jgi:uncharacterized membrane protein YidH (DUF202 family)